MKKLISKAFFFGIVLLMTDCIHIVAQNTAVRDTLGFVEGRIMDNSGSAIPGILLRVTAVKDSAFCAGAITDSLGRYNIEKLPLGRYVM